MNRRAQEQDAGEFMGGDGYAPNPDPTLKIPSLGGGKASLLSPGWVSFLGFLTPLMQHISLPFCYSCSTRPFQTAYFKLTHSYLPIQS